MDSMLVAVKSAGRAGPPGTRFGPFLSHPGSRFRAMVPPTGIADVRDAVAMAKAGEPLARVTAVPPSALAGLSLRRALAPAPGDGCVNVNVVWRSLAEVADTVVRASGRQGRGRLPRTGRLRAVAAAVGSRHRATVLAYDA